jgi:hypothetical protein
MFLLTPPGSATLDCIRGAAWSNAFPPSLLRGWRPAVDVQVQVAPGLPAFAIVGLTDKAVCPRRRRVPLDADCLN